MENLGNMKTISSGILPAGLMKSYREKLEKDLSFVSRSKYMKQLALTLTELSVSKHPITIVGPKGNGRAAFANAVHLASSDWWRSFIDVDLSGFDERTSMKYLLGHKEARLFYSGDLQPGLLSASANSTLCLRNFDIYPKKLQREIHNLYINKTYTPINGKEDKPVECRFIFTVRGMPENIVKAGFVDEDVGLMLSNRVVVIPPLSKRKDDIVPLAIKFIREWALEFGAKPKRIAKETEKWLRKAPWKENVTQLKKSIYHACMNTSDMILHPNHFALAHEGNLGAYQDKQLQELSIQSIIEAKLDDFMKRLGKFDAEHLHEAIIGRVEEPLLRLVLNHAGGNQIKASRMLGINRNTLRSKVVKYGIKVKKENG